MLRLLAFALVPGAFVVFLAFTLFRTSPDKQLEGQPAPDFELPLLSGGRLSSGQLKGRVVVFNFWASWCVPCREEAPALEAAWNKYRGDGLMLVGVNVQDSVEDAKAFVEEFGLTYPIVRDTDLKLWTRLGVRGLPETFFVDRGYRFVASVPTEQEATQGATKILGAIDPALLDYRIRSLLGTTSEPTGSD
ncbi:MAG: TlpA disulfide reductase family protein [Actinomycetota bacterium]